MDCCVGVEQAQGRGPFHQLGHLLETICTAGANHFEYVLAGQGFAVKLVGEKIWLFRFTRNGLGFFDDETAGNQR